MPRQYKIYLQDILEAAGKICPYTEGMTYQTFCENSLVADAVVRNLQIIGEAAKKIPKEVRQAHSRIEWQKIAGLRDILTHEYFGINFKIIWDVVVNKIPELQRQIRDIVQEQN